MSANSRFAIAVHVLSLLAHEDRPMSSSQLADSVNTNPVTIRKVLGTLQCAGLISTQMGAEGGSVLARNQSEINLLDVYNATGQGPLFAHHPKQPNPDCAYGCNITPVLNQVFGSAETALCQSLACQTIADVVEQIDKRIAN